MIAAAAGSRCQDRAGKWTCGRRDRHAPGTGRTVSGLNAIQMAQAISSTTTIPYTSCRGHGANCTSAPDPIAPTVRPTLGAWLEATAASQTGVVGAASTMYAVRQLLASPAPTPMSI